MNRNSWIIAVLVITVMALGTADVVLAKKKKADGKELFKEFCKPCHAENSDNGEYTPMTLIQDQWERFFDEKYDETHSKLVDPNHDNQTLSDLISEDDIEAIKKFAIDGAADSEHPMTCG